MERKQTKTEAGVGNKPYLKTYFTEEIKDIYWAEKHLVNALDKLANESTTDELRNAFEEHKRVTQEQVTRLEKVFNLLEEPPQTKRCEAIEGIIKEAERVISETAGDSYTRDVALIVAGQKVEHYEIATYGSLVELAKTMGKDEIADLLAQTLEEEKEADKTLTNVAESHINKEALSER